MRLAVKGVEQDQWAILTESPRQVETGRGVLEERPKAELTWELRRSSRIEPRRRRWSPLST